MAALVRCVKNSSVRIPHARVLTYAVLAETHRNNGSPIESKDVWHDLCYNNSAQKRTGKNTARPSVHKEHRETTCMKNKRKFDFGQALPLRDLEFLQDLRHSQGNISLLQTDIKDAGKHQQITESCRPVSVCSDHDAKVRDFIEKDVSMTMSELKQHVADDFHLSASPIVQCTGQQGSDKFAEGEKNEGKSGGSGANFDQLEVVETFAVEKIPHFFYKPVYITPLNDDDIEFENNYFSKRVYIRGEKAYVREMTKLRYKIRFRFAFLKMKVLKSTIHREESCVRVHWRVVTIGHLEIFKAWRLSKRNSEGIEWYDGISTFYVNTEGKITKHSVDRMTPLGHNVDDKDKRLALKVAGVTG